MFIREKKVDCQDYREVDVIPRTDNAEKGSERETGEAAEGYRAKAERT